MVKARHAGAQHGHAAQIVNAGDKFVCGDVPPCVGANPIMTDKSRISTEAMRAALTREKKGQYLYPVPKMKI